MEPVDSYAAVLIMPPDHMLPEDLPSGVETLADWMPIDNTPKKKKPITKCSHGNQKRRCRKCGYSPKKCPHGNVRALCVDCHGSCMCVHNRVRRTCVQCGGSHFICVHNRVKTSCVPCGGGRKCEHGLRRIECTVCFCEHLRVKESCYMCRRAARGKMEEDSL